jgi:hypothetical protein
MVPLTARSVTRQPNAAFKYVVDQRFEAPCTPLKSERAEMEDYVSRNWTNCSYEDKPTNCHKAFHFADVAIQHDTYDRADVGTRSAFSWFESYQAASAVCMTRCG